ncbi:hypothetical protein [Micromonospora musae]
MSTVPPGTPCRADLAIPDLADAWRFNPEPFGRTRADHAGAGEAKPKP